MKRRQGSTRSATRNTTPISSGDGLWRSGQRIAIPGGSHRTTCKDMQYDNKTTRTATHDILRRPDDQKYRSAAVPGRGLELAHGQAGCGQGRGGAVLQGDTVALPRRAAAGAGRGEYAVRAGQR